MNSIGIDTIHRGQSVGKIYHDGQLVSFLLRGGQLIYSQYQIPLPDTLMRVVTQSGKKWFEFGFLSADILEGSALLGWSDPGAFCVLSPQWSEDLVNWVDGQFVDAPVPFIDNGDGSAWYWSRARYPVDSAVKTATLTASQQAGDSRNNPLTGITVAGSLLSLPHYPYTMPTAAAQLQTDLRAAGYPAAVVSAESDVDWSITIPGASYTSFSQYSGVTWPTYSYAGPTGTTTISGQGFALDAVDEAGVPIKKRAFARLVIRKIPHE
jgi:hypothetical protein